MNRVDYYKVESCLAECVSKLHELSGYINRLLLLDQTIFFMSARERAAVMFYEDRFRAAVVKIDTKTFHIKKFSD